MNPINHVAIIMDGNGRWAIEKGLERSEGHIKGYQNIKPIVMAAIKSGIKFLRIIVLNSDRPLPRNRTFAEEGTSFLWA